MAIHPTTPPIPIVQHPIGVLKTGHKTLFIVNALSCRNCSLFCLFILFLPPAARCPPPTSPFSLFLFPFFVLCNCFFLIWFGPMYRSVPFPHSSFFVDCIFQYFALTHPSFFSTPLFFSLNNHIGLITRSLTDNPFGM